MKPIYAYLDFRKFLGDYYIEEKKNNPSFSYRSFSASIGIKAQNFLQWIIEGKRDIAEQKVDAVATAINLNTEEKQYFATLVKFCQSKKNADKDKFFNKLLAMRKPFIASRLDEYQYEHYSNWYNEVIRVMLNMIEFNPSEKYAFRKLAKMVRPKITESQARSAIKMILALGLAKKDKDGIIRQTDRITTTGDEVKSFYVKRYHEGMIDLAKASMDNIPSEERDISAITMNVSDCCFEQIKQELQDSRKRILELVDRDENSDNLYQMNLQFFPIAKKGGN